MEIPLANKKYRGDLFHICLLFIVVIIFFWKFIFLGLIPINGDWLAQWAPWSGYNSAKALPYNPDVADPILYTYPFKLLQTNLLKQGVFPLWNPYIFCGTPLFANGQSDVFNPFNFVFFIFSAPTAFGVLLFLQMFCAGLFMYVFLKSLKVAEFGCLVGAIVYMLNGFFTVYLEISTTIGPYIFMPLLFLFFDKALSEKKIEYVVFTAMVFAVQLFCEVQMALYSMLALFCYAFFRTAHDRGPGQSFASSAKPVILFLSAVGLTLLLSAVQFIPQMEFSFLSHRNIGAPRYYTHNYLPFYQLATFLFPNILGHPVDYNYIESSGRDYLQLCGYIGILPLILASIAIFFRRDKTTIFFTLLGLCPVVFLLLMNSQFLRGLILKILPSFHTLYHVRLLYLLVFAGSCLAGLGCEYMTKRDIIFAKLLKFAKTGFCFLIITVILLVFSAWFLQAKKDRIISLGDTYVTKNLFLKPGHTNTLKYYHEKVRHTYEQISRTFRWSNPAIFMPLIFLFVGFLLLFLYSKKKIKERDFKLSVIAMISFDLLSFGMKYNTFVDRSMIYPDTAAIDFIKQDRDVFRVSGLGYREGASSPGDVFRVKRWGPLPPDTNMPYGLEVVGGYDSLHLLRYKEFFSLIQEGPYANQNILYNHDSGLLGLLNMKYLLSSQKLGNDNFRLVYDKEVRIYENKNYLRRAFLVFEAKVIGDGPAVLDELKSLNFDPGKCVLIEGGDGFLRDKETVSGADPVTESPASTIEIRNYSPNEVRIDATLLRPGFLVLLDAYYPGWKAYDGTKEIKIFKADYLFRAIHLDKGRHDIRFVFDPKSFKIGVLISLVTLFTLLVIMSVKRYIKR